MMKTDANVSVHLTLTKIAIKGKEKVPEKFGFQHPINSNNEDSEQF